MILFPTVYTAGSVLWYSIRGLFINSSSTVTGDTNVFEFKNNNKKALILIHGISGTGDSGYIKLMYDKLKDKYDVYAPEYGTSDKHLYPTFFPVSSEPVYTRDVISLYRKVVKDYKQVSFVAFSAGGGALMEILDQLTEDDLEKLKTTFFISPALEMEQGFYHLESVWLPVRFFMKYDYWKKFFSWVKTKHGVFSALKFLFSCHTFHDIFKYFAGDDAQYPILSNKAVKSLKKKFVLIHPDDDPIVETKRTLDFLDDCTYLRIKQTEGGHIGFVALDRCVKFYQDDEFIDFGDLI